MLRIARRSLFLSLVCCLAACGDDDGPLDAGGDAQVDAAPGIDGAPMDGGPLDTGFDASDAGFDASDASDAGFDASDAGSCVAGAAGEACAPCAAGQYCPGGGAAAMACEAGSWDDDADPATECVGWSDCVAGEEVVTAGSATADRGCGECPVGTYSAAINAESCTPVGACAAGTYEVTPATETSPPVCDVCEVGTYCAGADASPVGCASGTWDHDANPASVCQPWRDCAAGGYVSAAGSATSNRECASCGSGTFSSSPNAGLCTAWTDCTSSEVEATAGTATTDRVCVPADACAAALGVSCEIFEDGYMKASNTGDYDIFGAVLALDGDTLVVGTSLEASAARGIGGSGADDTAPESGAVYVFVRVSGVWSQQAYIKASSSDAGDGFGESVAISGDTLAVGARYDDSASASAGPTNNSTSAENSGAVYVFRRTGTAWTETGFIKPSAVRAGENFGRFVALDGDTLVVGSPTENGETQGIDHLPSTYSATRSGAAYVFTRTSGGWTQQAYIKASNAEAGDGFGRGVSLDGDTLVVGATGEDSAARTVDGDGFDNAASGAGAAYVYLRSAGTWSEQAYLKASNGDAGDAFGWSTAIHGDTLVVGANGEDSAALGVGGSGSDNSATTSGAAYVFARSGGTWSQQAYLKASNTGMGDGFGGSVALHGEQVLVGASGERGSTMGVDGADDDAVNSAGAAYLFERRPSGWVQVAYIKASNTGAGDRFGHSVALTATSMAVGASGESSSATGVDGDQTNDESPESGAVYVRRLIP